jgi:hypothetical protein
MPRMVEKRQPGASRGTAGLRVGGVVALALLAAFVVWLVLRATDDDQTAQGTIATTTTAPTGPTTIPRQPAQGPLAMTPGQLEDLAADLGHPVYWAGPIPNRTYEVTVTRDGLVYVRYLPPGVTPGDERPNFLTIGTYPDADAIGTVERSRDRDGAQPILVGGDSDALAVVNESLPSSVYVAYRDVPFLVEVYSPDPAAARAVVRTGRLVTVG